MLTLGEWENFLSQKIAYVELLGELDLTDEQVEDLGKKIAQLVIRQGQSSAIGILERSYPVSLAVYLVSKGIYGYESGDYWSGVARETDLTGLAAQSRLVQFFEEFLRQRNCHHNHSTVSNRGSAQSVFRLLPGEVSRLDRSRITLENNPKFRLLFPNPLAEGQRYQAVLYIEK